MSLHYHVELEMPIAHMLPSSCYRKKLQSPEFIPLQLWPPTLPDLIPVDNSMWEILQAKLYKTHTTDLELSTTPLTNSCSNDDIIQVDTLHSQSLFQFVQINYVYFVHLLFQYSPHAVINLIQIWQIWGPELRWNKFWSFFL